jgi:flagellar basal-body rod protein FlgF
MGGGLYSAVSGAVGAMRRMDVLSNNLANISTPAYKGERMAFAEVLGKRVGAGTSDASFVAVATGRIDFAQGPLKQTGGALDVALEGPGYLTVQRGTGVAYTRGGALSISPKGELVLANSGELLLDEKRKPLRVAKDGVAPTIQRDGSVLQGNGRVGKLLLVEFDKPQQLERLGNTLYKASAAAGEGPATRTGIRTGFIERPNVNAVRGVTSMITASRAYEALHRVISTFREVDSAAARIANER